MDYSKERLDVNFKDILKKKEEVISKKYHMEYLEKINFQEVSRIGEYIAELKPPSKHRKYKEAILNYINNFIHDSELYNETEIVKMKYEYLEETLVFLEGRHNFHRKKLFIYVKITYGIIIDLFLIFIGIAKYYYYFPLFTFLCLICSISKQRRLQKEGKILNL